MPQERQPVDDQKEMVGVLENVSVGDELTVQGAGVPRTNREVTMIEYNVGWGGGNTSILIGEPTGVHLYILYGDGDDVTAYEITENPDSPLRRLGEIEKLWA